MFWSCWHPPPPPGAWISAKSTVVPDALWLALQVLETIFGIAIVRNAVRRYEPLPEDVFRYSLR